MLVVEAGERATLVLEDDGADERPASGTLVEGVVEAVFRLRMGRVHRELLLDEDHERYEPDEPADDVLRCGGHGSGAGLPGIAGAVSAGLPCGTQLWRGGVTA
jgi:hypothetical protein